MDPAPAAGPRPPAPLVRRVAGALLLALGALGCSERPAPEPGPEARLPEGALLVARTEPLGRLLEQFERLEGTPLARASAEARARLPRCQHLEAQAETLAGLLDRPQCALARALAPLRELRGDRALAFALPVGEGGDDRRLMGTLDWSPDGSVVVEAKLAGGPPQTLLGLILPAAEAPGPAVLSGRDALVHARLRTDAASDTAAAAARHKQLVSLLGVGGTLAMGAILDGTWEAALYVPDEGQSMPAVALALGVSVREAGVKAAERLFRELTHTWPVHRTAFTVGDSPGACLLDLTVLPELAPCYVATQGALVFGWNPASLRKALRADPPAALGEASSLEVDLARFSEADRVLAGTADLAAASAASQIPWRALRAEGRLENGHYVFRATLATGNDP